MLPVKAEQQMFIAGTILSDMAATGYSFSTDRAAMQLARIHRWLHHYSYWAKGIPLETVHTMIGHSFCIGAFHDGVQVGFARFVTDYAVFAYLADVYVEEAHRGHGISKQMMEVLMSQPWTKNLRRLTLATRDAHGLYQQFGFAPPGHPESLMEIVRPNIYQQITP
jgi:GNAT superfamily N-acetyltransferase